MEKRVVRAACSRLDDGGCGLLVTLEGGRVKKVEGDPDCAISQGFICRRAAALPELLYHPDRLLFPMVRVGERGAGSWKRVSWDEALEHIAAKLKLIAQTHGARSICLASGSPKGLEVFFMHRLASLLGTPNVSTPGNACRMPFELGQVYTYGGMCYPDQEGLPGAALLWGIDPYVTNAGGPGTAAWLRRAVAAGARIAVIDPRKTELASRGLWAQLRPGSDGALALGMLKVALEERLYDRGFVERWTVGWGKLEAYLNGLSLERIGEATWLGADIIRGLSRLYFGTRPAVILGGNALEHTPHSFQTSRALAILKAISGNIDQPGGEVLPALPPFMRPGELILGSRRRDIQQSMVGADFKLAHKNLFVPRQLIPGAIIEGEPYPLKALLFFGSNPMVSYPDSAGVYEALKRVDFLVVTDLFMTPTAELADVVLPAATALENNELGYYGTRCGTVVARPGIVSPAGECWSDIKIINELGKRLGFAADFWEDIDAALDEIVKPAGVSFSGLAEKGLWRGDSKYRKYEQSGFQTPSGKVELYSGQLEEMGYPPLPSYSEPVDLPGYPLVLSSRKNPHYFHSAYRNLKSARKLAPEPEVEVNPKTAASLSLAEGDWAYIETPRGRIKQRVRFNADLDSRVVYADFGWWFPERGSEGLYAWRESNVNVLTDASPAEPAVGSTCLRGFACRLRRYE